MTIYRLGPLREEEDVVEVKRWTIIFLVCGILVLVAAYGYKFIAYRNSIATEARAMQHLEVGMDIEAAKAQLQSKGFDVSEVETRPSFGTKVMFIKLVEKTSFDCLQYGMEVDLTPFSAEPKHWIVVKTSPGTDRIVSVESK